MKLILSCTALAATAITLCQALSMVSSDFNTGNNPFGTFNEGSRGPMVLDKMLDFLYETFCADLPRAVIKPSNDSQQPSFAATIMIGRNVPAKKISANVTAQEKALLRGTFAAVRGVWLGTGVGADDTARCAAVTDAHQKWLDYRKTNNFTDLDAVMPPPFPGFMPERQPGAGSGGFPASMLGVQLGSVTGSGPSSWTNTVSSVPQLNSQWAAISSNGQSASNGGVSSGNGQFHPSGQFFPQNSFQQQGQMSNQPPMISNPYQWPQNQNGGFNTNGGMPSNMNSFSSGIPNSVVG